MRFRLALLCAVLLLPSGSAARADGPPPLAAIDPVRFSYDDAIVERALIPSRDGVTVLAVDVIRPRTDENVPAILFQSPYYNNSGRGYRSELKTSWGPILPATTGSARRVPFPEWYDEYFVPRGYAIVMQDQRGTRNSSGCQVYGGPEEIDDAVDTIEWIASRPWSNGAVGMTGGSYDGTIAIGAAARAPEALKAIIPIRAIDRWYEYHFFNGVQSEGHAVTPWSFTSVRPVSDGQSSASDDLLFGPHVAERKACAASVGAAVAAQYSLPYQDARAPFWASRDYLKDAASFRAATFIIHGLKDSNVKPFNAGHLWQALPEELPKKLWLLRMEHEDPANPGMRFPVRSRFVEATHRWFAQFLKGIDAAALSAPVAVQAEDGAWHVAAEWPPPTVDHALYVRVGGLTGEAPSAAEVPLPIVASGGEMVSPLRIAGQSVVRLEYSLPQGGDTAFAATLWDQGPLTQTPIASGYARAAFRRQIAQRGPSWPAVPEPQFPGEVGRISFPLWHQDYVVPAGHRIVLEVATDDSSILGTPTGAGVTLRLGPGTALIVPVAGPRPG